MCNVCGVSHQPLSRGYTRCQRKSKASSQTSALLADAAVTDDDDTDDADEAAGLPPPPAAAGLAAEPATLAVAEAPGGFGPPTGTTVAPPRKVAPTTFGFLAADAPTASAGAL